MADIVLAERKNLSLNAHTDDADCFCFADSVSEIFERKGDEGY
mgnify:CR=1 FL=1